MQQASLFGQYFITATKNVYSVICMASTSADDCNGDALNDRMNGVQGLDQGIPELLDSLKCSLDELKQNVPEMFYWSKVR